MPSHMWSEALEGDEQFTESNKGGIHYMGHSSDMHKRNLALFYHN